MPPKDNGKGKAAAPYERVILRGAGQLNPQELAEFHRYMEEHNNTFPDARGRPVTFNQGVVSDGMHSSTSMGDPSRLPHIGIRLSNDALMRQDGTTHLFHFRPNAPQHHRVYAEGYTRTQVARMVEQKKAARDEKNKKNRRGGGQGGGSGGGASGSGTGRGNTTTNAGRGGSTQAQQQAGRGNTAAGAGRGASTQTQQQAGRGSGTTSGTTAGRAPAATQGTKK